MPSFPLFDKTQLKKIEVEGLTIYVDNDEVGQKIIDALKAAESRKWYSPAAEKVILYGKQSTKSGKLKVIALDLENVEPNANSVIYFNRDGTHEIQISTINTRSIQEKLIHELTHCLELGNPHSSSYSPKALEYKERLRDSLCQDYHTYVQQRDTLVPVQKEAARLIFRLPREYPVNEHTPEHLAFGMQAMVYSEKACYSIAPNYTQVLNEYIEYEIAHTLAREKTAITSTAPKQVTFQASPASSLKPKEVRSDGISISKAPKPLSIVTSKASGSSTKASLSQSPLNSSSKAIHPNETLLPKGQGTPPKLMNTTRIKPHTQPAIKPSSKAIYPDEIVTPNKRATLRKPTTINVTPISSEAKTTIPKTATINIFNTILQFGRNLFQLFKLYGYASSAYDRYSYLGDQSQAVHLATTAGVAVANLTLETIFWTTISRISPPVSGVLLFAKIIDSTPDTSTAFKSAWENLSADDFVTDVSPEEGARNIIYYGNPWGPCYGLKEEKLKELSTGVLVLDPNLLENRALDTVLRFIGGEVNQLLDFMNNWVDNRTIELLTKAGYPELNPAKDYNSISALISLQNQLSRIAPPQLREYKGDILTQTLAPAPHLQETPVSSSSSSHSKTVDKDVSNAVLFDMTYRSEFRESLKRGFDPKNPPPVVMNQPETPENPQFSFDLKGNGTELAAVLMCTFTEVGTEAMLLGLAGIVVGGIIAGVAWEIQKNKFNERVALIECQCNFISHEMKKTIKLYGKVFEVMEAAEKSENKSALLNSASSALFKAMEHTEKLIQKYERLVYEKHIKLDVVTPHKRDVINKFLIRRGIFNSSWPEYQDNPRYPKVINDLIKRETDKSYEKFLNKPIRYHHNKHAPRKETKKFIEDNLPVLKNIQESLSDSVLPYFIRKYLLNIATTSESNYTILEQKRRAYEEGHISQEDLDHTVLSYNLDLEESNQVLNDLLQWLPENHDDRTLLTEFIDTAKSEIQRSTSLIEMSHNARLKNDCESLANQLHSGMLSSDEFSEKMGVCLAGVSEEKKALWGSFCNIQLEIHHTILTNNDKFNASYCAYKESKVKIDRLIEQFVQGEIDKDTFTTSIESLLAESKKLKSAIASCGQPEEVINSFNDEFECDEKYYTSTIQFALQNVYNKYREQIISHYYESVVKNDIAALGEVYQQFKKLENPEERLYFMTNAHYFRESLLNKKRVVPTCLALPEALSMLSIDPWLELFVERTLRVSELENALRVEENAETKKILELALAENEALRNDAAKHAAQQIYYEKNADHLRNLHLFSYTHLTIDVLVQMLSERIKHQFDLTDRQFYLITQGIHHSLSIVQSHIHTSLSTSSITSVNLAQRAGLTAEQVLDFNQVMDAGTRISYLQSAHAFLSKYNTLANITKLAIVLIDFHLQHLYETSTAEALDKPSFDAWLAENINENYLSTTTTVLNYAVDGFTHTQLILSLVLFMSENADPLTAVRKVATAFFNLSYVHQFIHHRMRNNDGTMSEDRLYLFYCLLVEHMNGSQLQQLFHMHENTILNGILEVLHRNQFFDAASFLASKLPVVQNLLFMAHSFHALYNALDGVDQRVAEARIFNLKAKLLEIAYALQAASSAEEKKAAYRKAAGMYCDIKYATSYFNGTHPERTKLYVMALFYQHLLGETISVVSLQGDGNGLFIAVSEYTDDSPDLLRSKAANYIAAHQAWYEDFVEIPWEDYLANIRKKTVFADALIIHALSKVLQRPIIIVFNGMQLDLIRQGLHDPDSIGGGDPIFVYFDEDKCVYHSLHLREELYFEQAYQKKLMKKDGVDQAITCNRSTSNASLKTRVKMGQAWLHTLESSNSNAQSTKASSSSNPISKAELKERRALAQQQLSARRSATFFSKIALSGSPRESVIAEVNEESEYSQTWA